MTPVMLMIIVGSIFILSAMAAAINFASMIKGMENMDAIRKRMATHMILCIVSAISGLVAIGGFIWLLVEKFVY